MHGVNVNSGSPLHGPFLIQNIKDMKLKIGPLLVFGCCRRTSISRSHINCTKSQSHTTYCLLLTSHTHTSCICALGRPDRKYLIKIISTRYLLISLITRKYLVDMILINTFRSVGGVDFKREWGCICV
jgi:hypothetical protein